MMDGMRLVYKGDNDFAVVCGPLVIELVSNDQPGRLRWQFWNVRVGAERFGGMASVYAPAFVEWLNANADAFVEWLNANADAAVTVYEAERSAAA
jgi:hypothetical protein